MSVITPNRVAAVTTWLTAAGAFAYAIVGTFPQSWQPTTIIVAALATKAAVSLKFMTGSQKLDVLQANAPQTQFNTPFMDELPTETWDTAVANDPALAEVTYG